MTIDATETLTEDVQSASGSAPSPDPSGLTLDAFLPYRCAVLAEKISRALSKLYTERFGLSIPEWRIMANLGVHGVLSPQQAAQLGNMDKAKVSRAIASMVDSGLLRRDPDPADNRAALLRLSDRGVAVYRDIAPLALDWERELLAALTPDEAAALHSSFDKLLDRLDAGG